MFQGAVSASPDTSNWDTSNVESMGTMFNGAISANSDVSKWDTSRVNDMSGMFRGRPRLIQMYQNGTFQM